MHFLLKVSFYFLLLKSLFSAEFTMTASGIENFPVVESYNNENTFIIYSNQFQFITNTSMFGFGIADGVVEINNGKQTNNIFNKVTDSFGNIGYLKSIPSEEKTNIPGASIASWIWLGGSGPFAELKGIVMTGAYFQIGENKHNNGNFLWKGKAVNIPDNLIKKINSYKGKEEN